MSDPLPPPPAAGPGLPPPVVYSVPMLLPVLVLVFFLICFLSIFLLRDLLFYLSSRFRDGQAGANGGAQQDGGQAGLDPTIISSFPTLPYSSVRRIQEGKCGAECAVCLAEFGTGDVIRLLTVCCHAFHPGCIDSWLELHTTCPTCRSDLQAPPDEAAVLAVREAVEEGRSSALDEGSGVHSHVISVLDEGEEPKLNSMRRDGTAEGLP